VRKERTWRAATYPAATRIGALCLLLAATPERLSIAAVMNMFGVSERTLYRYRNALLAICGDELVWGDGRIALRPHWQKRAKVAA
jgi:predicted DNA-binding transcriptional regulator YafY